MGEAKRTRAVRRSNANTLIVRLGEWEEETELLVFNLDKEPLRDILESLERKYPAAPKHTLRHLSKVLIAIRLTRENKFGATGNSVEQLENMIPQSDIEKILGPIQ